MIFSLHQKKISRMNKINFLSSEDIDSSGGEIFTPAYLEGYKI